MEYKILNKKELENAEVELEIEIPWKEILPLYQIALNSRVAETELPGFRKGKAPKEMVLSAVGEIKILEDAGGEAVSYVYPKAIAEAKIQAIAQPIISVTKMAKDNPLVFKARVAVEPEIKLGNYQEIAKKINSEKSEPIEADEKEIEQEINGLKEIVANKDKTKPEEVKIDDEFAKKLGDFKDLNDLKTKIKGHIEEIKKQKAVQKKRTQIIEEIIKQSEIPVPEVMIERELQMMLERMKQEVLAMGTKFEDYLKQIKKTEEDLRKDWRETAKKQAQMHLILREIAKKEEIKPDSEKVEKEVKHIQEHHKDVDSDRARVYFEGIFTNEKVFEKLESY